MSPGGPPLQAASGRLSAPVPRLTPVGLTVAGVRWRFVSDSEYADHGSRSGRDSISTRFRPSEVAPPPAGRVAASFSSACSTTENPVLGAKIRFSTVENRISPAPGESDRVLDGRRTNQRDSPRSARIRGSKGGLRMPSSPVVGRTTEDPRGRPQRPREPPCTLA